MEVRKLYCDVCKEEFDRANGEQDYHLPIYYYNDGKDTPHFKTIKSDICNKCLRKIVSIRYRATDGGYELDYNPIPEVIGKLAIEYAKVDFGKFAKDISRYILEHVFDSGKINASNILCEQ